MTNMQSRKQTWLVPLVIQATMNNRKKVVSELDMVALDLN